MASVCSGPSRFAVFLVRTQASRPRENGGFMTRRDVVVRCEHGVHARVAARVVRIMQVRKSEVRIHCDGCREANACSMLELLTLDAGQGTTLQIVAKGPDEQAVVEALVEVFEDGSGI